MPARISAIDARENYGLEAPRRGVKH